MYHVREINDLDGLAQYRLLWNALLPQTRNATFFQSYDWLESYWRHFGDGQRLRVLIVHVDDEPIGILPLVVTTDSTRVGAVRVLTYPLHDWGTFYGPIGPNPTATLRAGLEHIHNSPRDWDLLDVRWVDAECSDRGRTARAMEAAGFVPHEQPWTQTAVVTMDRPWEEYWGSLQQKWRQNVRRNHRQLTERGKVTYVRYRPEGDAYADGDPRWDLFEACMEVARASWQGKSTTGTTMCHESVCAFLRDVHAAAARTGSLDLNLLLLDGRPIAFLYNYHYRGRVFGLRMGFDPALAGAGPGKVLMGMMLQNSFERGDRELDLGAGSLDAKRSWLTGLTTSYRYTHFPATALRANVLRLKRWYTRQRHGRNYLAGSKCRAV